MNRKFICILLVLIVLFTMLTACKKSTSSPSPSNTATITPTGTINLVPSVTSTKAAEATKKSSATKTAEATQKPSAKMPTIPSSISAGSGKEPSIKVYLTSSKSVKTMGLEEYVAGVVAGEAEEKWPLEALKAQAILARTFTLKFIEEKGKSKYAGAHISTDITEAQAWSADVSDKIKKAVSETKGMVVAYNGKFINPWFHSNAGGITAYAKEGLSYDQSEPAYIKSTSSPDSGAPADEKVWSITFTTEKFIAACKALGQDISSINSVSIGDKGKSGRAIYIKVNGKNVAAVGLRMQLGSTVFKSTLITQISLGSGKIYIEGKGYGHGVGMSQWGAASLAESGKTAKQIISYYFNSVDVGTVY